MFLKKLSLNLEIIGYSRAIGAMISQPGITADHMKGLYIGRDQARKALTELKSQERISRYSKAFTPGTL